VNQERLKYRYRIIDQRAGDDQLPLMAVSIHHGVMPRESLTDDLPRAEDLSNYKVCERGDIVLNRMRAFQGAIGLSHQRGIVSPDYLVLRPSSNTDPRYLHHLFRSSWFVGEMVSRLRGIGNTENGSVRTPRINPEDFGEIVVDFPSLEKQRRIADFLDAESATIDRLIALRRQQEKTLQENCNATISELLVPGISSSTYRSEAWPWIPAETKMMRLGYAARVQSGVTVDSGRSRSTEDVEYPYLRVANVQDGEIDLSEIKTIAIPALLAHRSTLRDGDVVMTEANGNPDNLGRGAVWHNEIPKMVHQNHIFAIRTSHDKLRPEYLSGLLGSIHGRLYFRFTSTQVGIATTSSSKVLDFPIPIRTIEEQERVSNLCRQASTNAKRAAEVIRTQLALLTERRQALITAAVTGQIDVTTARGGVT
jgi:type I restriction enzyme S subunit